MLYKEIQDTPGCSRVTAGRTDTLTGRPSAMGHVTWGGGSHVYRPPETIHLAGPTPMATPWLPWLRAAGG